MGIKAVNAYPLVAGAVVLAAVVAATWEERRSPRITTPRVTASLLTSTATLSAHIPRAEEKPRRTTVISHGPQRNERSEHADSSLRVLR